MTVDSSYAERNRRTGESRRRKTRTKLINAAIRVISERGVEAPTIDDFIQAADMSRGSFYNYFNTKDELVVAVADHVRAEMLRTTRAVINEIADPAEQLTWGVRHVVRHAHRDPQLGLLMLIGAQGIPNFDSIVRGVQGRTIRACIRKKRLPKQHIDLAVDLVIGVTRESTSRALNSSRPKDHAEQVAFLVLRGLGMTAEEAREVAWRPMFEVEPAADQA